MLVAPYGDIGYAFCIIAGIILAAIIFIFYMKKKGIKRNDIIDLLLTFIGAAIIGFVFAFVFQTIYDVIKEGDKYVFSFKMTFYGGLIGGVLGFLLLYFLIYIKKHKNVFDLILIIFPSCICFAHGLGRIGCFLAGCCYGVPTESVIGIIFPALNDGIKRIPTQLIEAIFLLLLGTILCVLAFKKDFKYSVIIYLFSYTIFRFVIEFYRGDNRGGNVNCPLSPSQIICIILFALTIPLIFILNKYVFKVKEDA